MNSYRSNTVKLALIGIGIFAIGLFAGYQLNNWSLASIQGYLFNAEGEASDANASDANASDANASDANASDANASDANVNATDNIIYLQYFALNSSNVKPGERVNVTIITNGAFNSAASIVFKNASGATFTTQIYNINSDPYIIIPTNVVASTYSVTDVLLIGRNSDNTTFAKQYSKVGANTYNFNSDLTIVAPSSSGNSVPTETKISLNNISLDSSVAKVSDKVYLNIKTSEVMSSLKLVFTSSDGKTFTVYAKDLLSEKPYIEIPSSTISGTYELTSAIVSGFKNSTAYSKNGDSETEKYNFNSVLEIKDGNEDTYIYNNEDITSEILTRLYNAPRNTEITINVNSNTIINGELFNVIKGTDKKIVINYNDNQIVFNGNDIDNSKTIDISMNVDSVSKNEKISKLVSNGVIVSFPANGNLPGKALIRLKITDDISKILNDNVYIYLYNEQTNNFCVIDTNVQKTSDGYYEFSITHNSEYLIVNEKLDSKLVVSEISDNTVTFQKSDKTLLMLIGIGSIVIVGAIVVVLIVKNKKKANNS